MGGSERPCSEASFISNLLWGAFRLSLIIQEMEIAENSIQQTTDGEQLTKSAANQHRVRGVICNALLVKWIFSI